MTATLGTFDVAATVDGVSVKGEGQSKMTLSGPLLSALNRQLQFITYTNTVFHPNTADTGKVCIYIYIYILVLLYFFTELFLFDYIQIQSQN